MTSDNEEYSILKQSLPSILSWEVKRMQRTVISEFSDVHKVFTYKGNDLELLNKNIVASPGGFV